MPDKMRLCSNCKSHKRSEKKQTKEAGGGKKWRERQAGNIELGKVRAYGT